MIWERTQAPPGNKGAQPHWSATNPNRSAAANTAASRSTSSTTAAARTTWRASTALRVSLLSLSLSMWIILPYHYYYCIGSHLQYCNAAEEMNTVVSYCSSLLILLYSYKKVPFVVGKRLFTCNGGSTCRALFWSLSLFWIQSFGCNRLPSKVTKLEGKLKLCKPSNLGHGACLPKRAIFCLPCTVHVSLGLPCTVLVCLSAPPLLLPCTVRVSPIYVTSCQLMHHLTSLC
jgi:hypothetical protein